MADQFTVGDLRRSLNGLKDDDKLTFAGGLAFYRVKRVADDEFFIAFSECRRLSVERLQKEQS